MAHRAREPHTVNHYIYGGVGGNGGAGGVQGGGGGTGEGPTMNYDIGTVETINNLDIQINHRHGEAGIHILHRAVALEALYDAAENFSQPKCHPETRTQLLGELYHWATDQRLVTPIRWLHGPAGAGKSAVMLTLCRQLKDAGKFSGGFFFKRRHATRGNAKMLFATLAYQLALHRRELKTAIAQSVETDPSVLGKGMDDQLHTLIVEPCKLVQHGAPPILLVDGLDECDGHNIQQEILRLIGSAANDHRLRILVASRPEPHIRETFESECLEGLVNSTNIQQSFVDVRKYLRNEFSRIHREHSTMRSTPSPWPSSHTVEMLVQKSSGYFIYASTVIKFVGDEYSRPSKQLDILQNIVPHDSNSPFDALDQLYIQILMGVPVRSRPTLCDILSVLTNYPTTIDLDNIDELLDLERGDARLILRPLHSILKLPAESGPIEVYHASLHDFLKNQERSSIFHVGSPESRAKLACSILKALAYTNGPRNHLRFRWDLFSCWMPFIASLPYSADLGSLVGLVNPYFVLHNVSNHKVETFLSWLKGIHPAPGDLIRRWETYHLIRLCQDFWARFAALLSCERAKLCPKRWVLAPSLRILRVLQGRMNAELRTTITALQESLSRSPHLIGIFKAGRQLRGSHIAPLSRELLRIHTVLDLSWDDILAGIHSLRSLATRESDVFYTTFLFMPMLCHELDSLYPDEVVSRDLALGFIRLIQRIGNGTLPMLSWKCLTAGGWQCPEWGRHIRSSSPADPELLQKLDEFVPPWDVFRIPWDILEPVEFHDVVQWLKSSPEPLPDLLGRWQGYLEESMNRLRKFYTWRELENRWQQNLMAEAYFHGPPEISDEEIIRYWDHCLRNHAIFGGGSREAKKNGV